MTTSDSDISTWASEEFGSVGYKHTLKRQSLVRVGGLVAKRPGPHVTRICERDSDRQAMYGFLENKDNTPEEITDAAGRAALGRSESAPYVIVSVDGTDICLTDKQDSKGFGQVGKNGSGRGLQVQTALALTDEGTPFGVLAQRYWIRPLKTGTPGVDHSVRRPISEKETQHWLDVVEDSLQRKKEVIHTPVFWFQMDRGYDAWPLLERLEHDGVWYTIRSAYNRTLWHDAQTTPPWKNAGRIDTKISH